MLEVLVTIISFLIGLGIFVAPIYFIIKSVKKKNVKKQIVQEENNEVINQKFKKQSKGALIFFGITMVLLVGAIIATNGGKTDIGGKTRDKQLLMIMDSIGVTEEQSKDITKVLNEVGITSFESITHDESLDTAVGENSKGYRVKTSFSSNVILYIIDNKVNTVRWADKDFYKDNAIILHFKDFTMTGDEKSNYNIDAQKRIKSLLKSPNTAKFPSITEWKFGKDYGAVTLQSYVDSQNSFGATVHGQFQIKYDKDKNITSLIFDGVEYIK